METICPLLVTLMLTSVFAYYEEMTDEEYDHYEGKSQRYKREMNGMNEPPGDEDAEESVTHMVDRLFNRGYNKNEHPMHDRPTAVSLGVYVNSFYSISEQTMDYAVSMYLRQAWRDPRLAFIPPEANQKQVRLGEEHWKQLWLPDTFFRNEKKASFHHITVPNTLMRLNATGHLWYVRKISATLSCQMKLQKYPMDTQTCPIMFESFGYTMDVMYFIWLATPIDIDSDVRLPQFTLMDAILHDCSQNYTAGAFPCLEIRFVLRRDLGFFMIQVYVPSILIVILSWVNFWISVDAVMGRVYLGLLTVLTMTTQSTGARSSLPPVSYIKAIDVWMSMCLIFVFLGLLEYAVVNVLSRKEVRTIKPVRRAPPPHINPNDIHKFDQIINIGNDPPKTVDPQGKIKAAYIDKVSRKAFPLSFLVFNIGFWLYYSLPSSNEVYTG